MTARPRSSANFDDEPSDEDLPTDSIGSPETPDLDPETENGTDPSDPHNVEYYLAQIPTTEEQIATANDVIQEGLYNEGLILKDRLEDFPAARKEFLTLEQRYPDNIYRLDVYYNLYLMAVRSDQTAEAEKWRQKIIADFPNSPYGKAMTDPNYFDNLRRMNQIQEETYTKAYQAYLDDRNSRVHDITREMEQEYPLSQILPKFVFIDALSYLTEKDNDRFRERLTELLEKWPDTDMTDMAGSILRGLKSGRVPNSGSGNSRGMVWTMRLSNDSVPLADDGQPANFERDPDKPQLLVLVFPRDSISANQLLYDVARFNFSSFVVRDFDLEPMSFGNVGLLVISGFDNLRQLEHYRSVMERSPFRIPEGVRPVMISKANFDLLLREGRSFEEYFRFEENAIVDEKEALINEDKDPDNSSDIIPDSETEVSDSETENPGSEAEIPDSGTQEQDSGTEEPSAPETL